MNFFKKLFGKEQKESLNQGLKKTQTGFFNTLSRIFSNKTTVDEATLDEIEEALILADIGTATSLKIIDCLKEKVKKEKITDKNAVYTALKIVMQDLLKTSNNNQDFDPTAHSTKPYIILVVGVNGVGKTTTIGKLAYNYTKAGYKVMLGAADTFRAAATEQLTIWSERVGVPIVKQKMGSDPSAVAFDTVQSAIAKGIEIVIIDTAGRLHNKTHLMEELSKIKRVIKKILPEAPQEILLVLDGSTGQNALEQAKQFSAATDVNALVITKLDGTAKGGAVLAIADQFKIPIRFIGVGEKKEDLLVFDTDEYVDSLFGAS